MLTEKIIKFCSLGDVGALQRLRVAPHALRMGDYDRRTPLHLSVSNGHEAMVRYLCEKLGREHVNPTDRWGGTPYDDALREKHEDIAKMLRAVGGKTSEEIGGKTSEELGGSCSTNVSTFEAAADPVPF